MEQGLSQTELGEILGVTFQQVQKYEKGANRVTAARLQQIAKALGAPLSYFYGDEDSSVTRHADSLEFLDSALSVRLLRAFSKIPNQNMRHTLVDLIESLVDQPSNVLPMKRIDR